LHRAVQLCKTSRMAHRNLTSTVLDRKATRGYLATCLDCGEQHWSPEPQNMNAWRSGHCIAPSARPENVGR
jgi:hypothetical protein